MRTDDLIRALAQDGTVGPGFARMTAWALPPAALISLAGLLAVLGPRPDFAAALLTPAVLRHVLTLLLFGLAFGAVITLSRPEGRPALWPLLAVPALAALVYGWAWAGTPPGGREMALYGKTIWVCLTSIPLLSVLPVGVILTVLRRRGGTTRPALAGALAGLAGGGLGAFVYAVHCTESSPLFWVTWYGLAILGVTLVSTLIGSRLLRW